MIPFVSPLTRLVADEIKPTKRPSALIAGRPLSAFACVPDESTLTRSVVPVCRSRTNTSSVALVSFGTRFEAGDEKATKRPSPLMAGASLERWPGHLSNPSWLVESDAGRHGRPRAQERRYGREHKSNGDRTRDSYTAHSLQDRPHPRPPPMPLLAPGRPPVNQEQVVPGGQANRSDTDLFVFQPSTVIMAPLHTGRHDVAARSADPSGHAILRPGQERCARHTMVRVMKRHDGAVLRQGTVQLQLAVIAELAELDIPL